MLPKLHAIRLAGFRITMVAKPTLNDCTFAAALGHSSRRPNRCKAMLLCAVFLLLAVGSLKSTAQSSGGEFEVTNSTIDNGGGRSSGGQFTLTGSIGQPDASIQTATGGEYQLTGGFWTKGDATPTDELLFADGFEGF